MSATVFRATIWGARGSLPVSRPEMQKYGGATSCLEVKIGHQLVIIDAGTGIQQLGEKLSDKGGHVKAHLLLSHVHWDHIQGFPFFDPAYAAGNEVHIYGETRGGLDVKAQLARLMVSPFWPVGLEAMAAKLVFHAVEPGKTVQLDSNVTVATMRGRHPGGTLLFRIAEGGRSLCYIADYEHLGEGPDPALVAFVRNTDVLIYDAMFTDGEYYGTKGRSPKRGWGHSTWQEGCRLADMARAKRLILFHHAINRTDEDLEKIELAARTRFPNTQAAYGGMEIEV